MAKPLRADATGAPPDVAGTDVTIGQRLRARREERGVSLREFARRLGLSPSAISKIETDKYRPSASTLWSIVSELGMSLDELFAAVHEPRATRAAEAHRPPPRRAPTESTGRSRRVQHVQRADSRKTVELDSGVTWERLTPTTDPEADFLFVRYGVGGSSSKDGGFIRHAGREYGLVLRGTLEVAVGLDVHVLGPGDSISFDSTTPHRLRNISDEPVEGIWTVIGRYELDPSGDEDL